MDEVLFIEEFRFKCLRPTLLNATSGQLLKYRCTSVDEDSEVLVLQPRPYSP